MLEPAACHHTHLTLTDIAFDTVSAVFKPAADLGRGALMIGDGTDSARIVLLGQYAANFTTSAPLPGFTGFVLSDDGTPDHGTKVTYVTASP